jgi:hypothetical protein
MLAIHALSNKEDQNNTSSTGITTYNDPTTEFHIEQRVRQLLGHQQDPQAHDEDIMGLRGKRPAQKAIKKHLINFSILLGHVAALFICRGISLRYFNK